MPVNKKQPPKPKFIFDFDFDCRQSEEQGVHYSESETETIANDLREVIECLSVNQVIPRPGEHIMACYTTFVIDTLTYGSLDNDLIYIYFYISEDDMNFKIKAFLAERKEEINRQ